MRPAVFTAMFLSAVCLPLAAQTTSPSPAVISVCVGNLTGLVREVPAARDCLKGLETFQQFNAQGPQGPQGVQGLTGPVGPQGPVGPVGPAGAKGATGNTGPQGLTGAVGAQGPAGQTGAAGAIGPQGPVGPSGAVGLTGPQGPAGPTGSTGATGAQGAAGAGYRATSSGSTGPFSVGSTQAFQTQSGLAYVAGDRVRFRASGGDPNNYVDGTVTSYVSSSTGSGSTLTFVVDANGTPGAAGSWTISLIAAPGATGATGATGPVGPQGLPGPQGLQGPAGANGSTGSIGATGATGAGYYGTSTTMQTIAVDSLTFTTQPGLAYVPNSRVRAIAATASPTFVEGTVHDYQGTKLRIDVDTTSGSGIYSQWTFSLAGVQGIAGAAGPQGIAGPAGPQGAVGKAGVNGKDGKDGADGKPGAQGPTGPTGPAGPQYYVHFYTQTKNVPGTAENVIGGYDSESYNMACPVNETVVSGSCGYQAPESTSNQGEIHVNYAGVDNYRPNSAQCSVSNSNLSSNNIIIGISCLSTSPVPFGLVNSAAVKSCTYDPDTQAPCTAADAVPATETGPGRFLAAPAAEMAATASATSTESTVPGSSQQGKTAGQSRKSITLWFRQ